MNRPLRSLALVTALGVTSLGSAATILADLGDRNTQTAGNYNNFTQDVLSIADVIDSNGASTGIGIDVTGFNPGSNPSGTQTPSGDAAMFDPQTTRDNFFGHTSTFSGAPPTLGSMVTLTGLDGSGATTYDITFLASRMGVNDNREATYTITSPPLSTSLDAGNNDSHVATIAGIVPDASGTLSIDVDPGANNSNGFEFYYLGGMKIESVTIPEPASSGLAVLALSACSLLRRRS